MLFIFNIYTYFVTAIRSDITKTPFTRYNRLSTGCQTGCTTGLTTGCIVYTNIYPVVKPAWQPVWQQVVSCKRGLTVLMCCTTVWKITNALAVDRGLNLDIFGWGVWALRCEPYVLFTGSIARSASLPVFNLLRGRFWGFSARRGVTLHRWGEIWHEGGDRKYPNPCQISPPSVQRQEYKPPKLKFLHRYDRNVEHKRPAGAYPVRDFHKIADFVPHFRMR